MIPDLKEIRNTIIKIENRLNYLLNQKQINFERTQPGSPRLKEAIVDSSHNFVDTFALYMIKDEQLDDEIEELRDSYYNWIDYFTKEFKRLKNYDDLLIIEFLRNELHWKWDAIDEYLHYGYGSSRVKYDRHFKNNESKNNQVKESRKK